MSLLNGMGESGCGEEDEEIEDGGEEGFGDGGKRRIFGAKSDTEEA